MSARDVRLVQTCYPQIYLACHTRHMRAASSPQRLSPRDSTLLAHLDEKRPIRPSVLARHLGVGGPTISAAVKRLVRLGYIEQERDPDDARSVRLRLGQKGAAAMRDSSVLEPARVRRMLEKLAPGDRRAALKGLAVLAGAARRVMEDQ
jgi:MarR family transcriptional regulator, organic hydroperoxide resistance regulator